jgi:hypothetical protein
MNGEDVTIKRVQEAFDIQYAQARADLVLLEDIYELATERKGRVKVWRWDGFNPSYITVGAAALLKFGEASLDLFSNTRIRNEIERVIEHAGDLIPARGKEAFEKFKGIFHLRPKFSPEQDGRLASKLEQMVDAILRDECVSFVDCQTQQGRIGKPGRIIWCNGRLKVWISEVDGTHEYDLAALEKLEMGIEPAIRDQERRRVHDHDNPETLNGGVLQEADSDQLSLEFGHLDFGWDDKRWRNESLNPQVGELEAADDSVEDVQIEVQNQWARYLDRYQLHPTQTKKWSGESLVVTLEVQPDDELESLLVGMIPDVIVHKPDSLREEITDRVQRWLERAATR